jgi:hypothetical protein
MHEKVSHRSTAMTPKTFKVSKDGGGKRSCPRATGFSNHTRHDQLEQMATGDLLSLEKTKRYTEQPSISHHPKAQHPEKRLHDLFCQGQIDSTRKRDPVPASDHVRESIMSGDIETTKNRCTLKDDVDLESATEDAA